MIHIVPWSSVWALQFYRSHELLERVLRESSTRDQSMVTSARAGHSPVRADMALPSYISKTKFAIVPCSPLVAARSPARCMANPLVALGAIQNSDQCTLSVVLRNLDASQCTCRKCSRPCRVTVMYPEGPLSLLGLVLAYRHPDRVNVWQKPDGSQSCFCVRFRLGDHR